MIFIFFIKGIVIIFGGILNDLKFVFLIYNVLFFNFIIEIFMFEKFVGREMLYRILV